MIIISEKLNSSIPSVKKVFDSGDKAALEALIKEQYDYGARMFDINTAVCASELEKGKEAADAVMSYGDCGIVIDSPSEEIVEKMLEYINGRTDVIINSVSVSERLGNIDLAVKYSTGIIVMLTDENGIPDSAEKRFENACRMIGLLNSKGISNDRIYIDPIVETVAVNDRAATVTLDTIALVRKRFSDVHITCGASNVSFGLPRRAFINNAFMAIAIYLGMDAPICSITAPWMDGTIRASEMLAGHDEFCMNYIEKVTEAYD